MKEVRKKALVITLATIMALMTAAPYQAVTFSAFAEDEIDAQATDETPSDTGEADADAEEVEIVDAESADGLQSDSLDTEVIKDGALNDSLNTEKVRDVAKTVVDAAEPDSDADSSTADVELTYEGEGYDITLTGGTETGLTEDTALDAREIENSNGKDGNKEDSEKYDEYMSLCESELATVIEAKQSIKFAKFYDITLTDGDGQEFEPDAPVDVNIKYDKKLASKLKTDGDGKLSVIHFKEDANTGEIEAEVIGTDSGKGSDDIEVSTPNDQLKEVSFAAESFSVYAVVYTVDFHYGDGEYDFSIEGESSILLSEIFERLHIDDIDMADIESVEFSDPELIKVEKAADAENDWLLTSLAPFDTEETLTITLNEGSKIEIKVTDEQRDSEEEATFSVTYNNQTTYWDTWAEAVRQANLASSTTVVIALLQDYTVTDAAESVVFSSTNFPVTINGNGHKITMSGEWDSDLIRWNKTAAANTLTINNLTIDGAVATGSSSFIRNTSTRSAAVSISNCQFLRGDMTGTLIDGGDSPLTLTSCTVNGQNKTVNSSLIVMGSGAGALTLTDTTVTGHIATGDITYAVNAAKGTGRVNINGTTSVTGNTAAGAPSNIGVTGTSRLYINTGNTSEKFTGTIGVSSLDRSYGGAQFGLRTTARVAQAGTITNDNRPSLTVVEENNATLKWSTISNTGYAVKITDTSGNILYYGTNNNHKNRALFNNLGDIANYVNETGNNGFFVASGNNAADRYTGDINVEVLRDIQQTGSVTLKPDNKKITIKTAETDAAEYPFTGSGSRATIEFTIAGQRFVLQGSGENNEVRFENIIIDGRNIVADEGALITIGFVGTGSYSAVLTLGTGAVLQNGVTNPNDQGGGIYVAKGCVLNMEPGSIIQNCKSPSGGRGTGGAIYLNQSTLYCNGGIIRNCVSVNGGAVDGGGNNGSQNANYRIYFSGSPHIIDNYNLSGEPLNVHLNYNTNAIINVNGDLSSDARIGIYPDDDGSVYANHGHETQPFGTIASGISPDNLSAFINDREQRLIGERSVTDSNLVVWGYLMNVTALDDYYIDDVLINTNEIDNSTGTFVPGTFPKEYTTEEFAAAYQSDKGYNVNKKSEIENIVLESYNDNSQVSSGIKGIRYVISGQGRQWQYTTNGLTWSPISGRDLTLHYARENRDNIKFIKNEDTNSSELLPNATFKLERSYPRANSYALYTNGSGKGRGDVTDTSANGIYTTNENGEFIMNLPEGYYRLTEVSAPDGYEPLSDPINFKVAVYVIPDTVANREISPYRVEQVGANAIYAGNDYATWSSQKFIGSLTVGNVRQIPAHVLLQKSETAYELKDDTTCVSAYTSFVTAGLAEGEKSVTGINTAKTGYKRLHVYYGSASGTGYIFEKDGSDPIEVTKLEGTENGIIVNGANGNVLTNDMALYYVFVKDVSPKVTYDANGGSFTDGTTFEETITFEDTEFTKVYDVSDTEPSWQNHIFVGWNTEADGTGTAYAKDSTITFDRDENSSDITLYAQWKEVTFLRVTKVLPGEYDNRTEAYSFSISIDGGSKAIKVDGNTEQELTSDSFALKHNESILFKVPANTKITIAETKVNGYGVEISTTNIASPSIFNKNETAGSVEVELKQLFTASAPGDVTFSNSLTEPIVPSGLTLKNWTGRLVFLLVVMVLAAEATTYIYRRRRSE